MFCQVYATKKQLLGGNRFGFDERMRGRTFLLAASPCLPSVPHSFELLSQDFSNKTGETS